MSTQQFSTQAQIIQAAEEALGKNKHPGSLTFPLAPKHGLIYPSAIARDIGRSAHCEVNGDLKDDIITLTFCWPDPNILQKAQGAVGELMRKIFHR